MMNKMNDLINKLSNETFIHGKSDCFTFTNELVKAWHGKDFRSLHTYKNKKEALRYMIKHGGIEVLTTGTLGYPVNTDKLCDGDVIIAEVAENEIALGFVFNGHGLFKGKKRVMKLPLNKCIKGWRIK